MSEHTKPSTDDQPPQPESCPTQPESAPTNELQALISARGSVSSSQPNSPFIPLTNSPFANAGNMPSTPADMARHYGRSQGPPQQRYMQPQQPFGAQHPHNAFETYAPQPPHIQPVSDFNALFAPTYHQPQYPSPVDPPHPSQYPFPPSVNAAEIAAPGTALHFGLQPPPPEHFAHGVAIAEQHAAMNQVHPDYLHPDHPLSARHGPQPSLQDQIAQPEMPSPRRPAEHLMDEMAAQNLAAMHAHEGKMNALRSTPLPGTPRNRSISPQMRLAPTVPPTDLHSPAAMEQHAAAMQAAVHEQSVAAMHSPALTHRSPPRTNSMSPRRMHSMSPRRLRPQQAAGPFGQLSESAVAGLIPERFRHGAPELHAAAVQAHEQQFAAMHAEEEHQAAIQAAEQHLAAVRAKAQEQHAAAVQAHEQHAAAVQAHEQHAAAVQAHEQHAAAVLAEEEHQAAIQAAQGQHAAAVYAQEQHAAAVHAQEQHAQEHAAAMHAQEQHAQEHAAAMHAQEQHAAAMHAQEQYAQEQHAAAMHAQEQHAAAMHAQEQYAQEQHAAAMQGVPPMQHAAPMQSPAPHMRGDIPTPELFAAPLSHRPDDREQHRVAVQLRIQAEEEHKAVAAMQALQMASCGQMGQMDPVAELEMLQIRHKNAVQEVTWMEAGAGRMLKLREEIHNAQHVPPPPPLPPTPPPSVLPQSFHPKSSGPFPPGPMPPTSSVGEIINRMGALMSNLHSQLPIQQAVLAHPEPVIVDVGEVRSFFNDLNEKVKRHSATAQRHSTGPVTSILPPSTTSCEQEESEESDLQMLDVQYSSSFGVPANSHPAPTSNTPPAAQVIEDSPEIPQLRIPQSSEEEDPDRPKSPTQKRLDEL